MFGFSGWMPSPPEPEPEPELTVEQLARRALMGCRESAMSLAEPGMFPSLTDLIRYARTVGPTLTATAFDVLADAWFTAHEIRALEAIPTQEAP